MTQLDATRSHAATARLDAGGETLLRSGDSAPGTRQASAMTVRFRTTGWRHAGHAGKGAGWVEVRPAAPVVS